MILIDVNVLVYAHREAADNHPRYKKWLLDVINGETAYGLSELVLSSFIRIVTHPQIFNPPSTLKEALAFITQIKSPPNCIIVRSGLRHWEIFETLCHQSGAKGNLVPDAYLAALAIESGCEWMTTDRDFTRFPGLKVRHPLE